MVRRPMARACLTTDARARACTAGSTVGSVRGSTFKLQFSSDGCEAVTGVKQFGVTTAAVRCRGHWIGVGEGGWAGVGGSGRVVGVALVLLSKGERRASGERTCVHRAQGGTREGQLAQANPHVDSPNQTIETSINYS